MQRAKQFITHSFSLIGAVVTAVVLTLATLAPQAANASVTTVTTAFAFANQQTGTVDANLYTVIEAAANELREIPYFGNEVVDPLMAQLRNLPLQYTPSNNDNYLSNWPYIEYVDGNIAVTIFDIGSYAGVPRIVVGFSYNGILASGDAWSTEGVWGFLPGADLHYPTVLFRPSLGVGITATPVVPGDNLELLPGQLGYVANKAAEITRTLRIPEGALVLAGFQAQGALATAFELFNLPQQPVYLMAGGGLDAYPPGGTVSGQDVDPVVASWQQGRTFARDDGQAEGQAAQADFTSFDNMMPSASGYVKISVPGQWQNPMTMFDFNSHATDAVLMFTYSGDVSSWGAIHSPYGAGNDFVYAIDIPGVLKGASAELPKMGVGLSFDALDLGDVVMMKLGMMTNLSRVDFLRKLSVLAGASGYDEAAVLSDVFDMSSGAIVQMRDIVQQALDELPLDAVQITNPAYVAYDAVKQSYPPSTSFNFYFSASNGITATGERGPIVRTNGEFEFLGETLASTQASLYPKTGLEMYSSLGGDYSLGTVLGNDLNIEGKQKMKVEAKISHVIMQTHSTLNLVGITKQQALMDFLVDENGPQMHFIYDPSGGCVPPMPLRVDQTVGMPTDLNDLDNHIMDLIDGVDLSTGGIVKCANSVYDLGKVGAEYLGDGIAIGGGYAADGADYVADYGAQGTAEVNSAVHQGASQVSSISTDGYNAVSGATGSGVSSAINWASNAANSIADVAQDVGCSIGGLFGGGGCGESSSNTPQTISRVRSPFVCPQGQFYSLEFGRCWAPDNTMYAYTGGNTRGPQCISILGSNPARVKECWNRDEQIFSPQSNNANNLLSFAGAHGEVCLVPENGAFVPGARLVSGPCGSAPEYSLDDKGQFVAEMQGQSLCVLPDSPLTDPVAFGAMADWKALGGHALDITVDAAGRVYDIGGSGDLWEVDGTDNWAQLGGSNLVRLDAGLDGVVWAVDASGSVLRYDNGAWEDLGGNLTEIGVGGPNGDVIYGIQQGGAVVFLDGNGNWVSGSGTGVRIDVDGSGRAWGVQANGLVWKRGTDPNVPWIQLPSVPGGAADISAGRSGTIMVSTKRNEIYVLTPDEQWARFPGRARDIAVGQDGTPWVSLDIGNAKGKVFVHNSSPKAAGWTGLPQPDAFVSHSSQQIGDEELVLAECGTLPTTAWTPITPNVQTDYAAQAGLTHSFRLEHEVSHESGAALRAVAYDWQDAGGEVPVVAMTPSDAARTEYSAVFVAADQFALYNHVTGLCITDPAEHTTPMLRVCSFEPEQLWTRTEVSNRPGGSGFLVENVETERLLTPSSFHYYFANDDVSLIDPQQTHLDPDDMWGWRFTETSVNPAAKTDWIQMPGDGPLDIAIGPTGDVWCVGGGRTLWRLYGTAGWEQMTGPAEVTGSRIDVGPDAIRVVDKNSSGLYRIAYDGDVLWPHWATGSGLIDVSMGADGSLWCLAGGFQEGNGHQVWKWENDGWVFKNGHGRRIAVGPDGIPWMTQDNGSVWYYNNGWHQGPGSGVADIAFGADASLWCIGGDVGFDNQGPVYRMDKSGGWGNWQWEHMNAHAKNIAVGPNGFAWIVDIHGDVYRWGGR